MKKQRARKSNRRIPLKIPPWGRLKTNVRKNTQYYRRRSFMRKLVNDPFKYYIAQKIKNYPHVYSRHYDIPAAPNIFSMDSFNGLLPIPRKNQFSPKPRGITFVRSRVGKHEKPRRITPKKSRVGKYELAALFASDDLPRLRQDSSIQVKKESN